MSTLKSGITKFIKRAVGIMMFAFTGMGGAALMFGLFGPVGAIVFALAFAGWLAYGSVNKLVDSLMLSPQEA